MAQQLITLAKEETSQDILAELNSLKTIVNDISLKTAEISNAQKIGGGVASRKFYRIIGSSSSYENPTVTITGCGYFTWLGVEQAIGLKAYDSAENITYMQSTITAGVKFEFKSKLSFTPGSIDNTKPIMFCVEWQDEVGTVTKTAGTLTTY